MPTYIFTFSTENFSTIEEIIAKYSATCINLKIRPCTQILDQLSVSPNITNVFNYVALLFTCIQAIF